MDENGYLLLKKLDNMIKLLSKKLLMLEDTKRSNDPIWHEGFKHGLRQAYINELEDLEYLKIKLKDK